MDWHDDIPLTPQASSGERPEDAHNRIADALTKLAVCVRSLGQYGSSHPLILEMAGTAHLAISELLAVQPMVAVAVGDSYFALDSFPIEDKSGSLTAFAGLLHERQIGLIKMTAGVTKAEVVAIAEALSLSPEDLTLRGGIQTETTQRGITHIAVEVGVLPTESREGMDPADIYEEALILVEEAMRAVQSGLQVPVPEIRAVVADALRSLAGDDKTLLALAGIRSYDRYLAEHSVNVCILSMVLGRDLGLDSASSLELGVSAMLHDVGKVFVPGDIVRKPGRLTEQEWEHIRRHPTQGARALAGLHDLPALASTIALQHHIRTDGSGYPALPPGQKPHLLSRLVAIVDSYDALTTDRPYRRRWTAQEAIAWMIYEAPGQYDRQLMARFASRAQLYPIGSLVRLKRGDYAVVVGGSYQNPRRPVIQLVGEQGKRAGQVEPIRLADCDDSALDIDAVAQPVEVLLPLTDNYLAAANLTQ